MISKITILLFVLLWSVPLSAPAVAEEAAQQDSADQQLTDFSLSGFGDRGKKSWELSGKSADIMTDTVNLQDVEGKLYGENEDIKLTADKGNFNKADGKVHLEQNVHVSTSSGAKLTTNSLNWDRKSQVVATKDTVNIERENIIATALGAVGHPDLNKVSLQKDVQVDIKPVAEKKKDEDEFSMSKGKIAITCEGPLEIDYQKNIATFNKKVKVDTDSAVIYSDIMEMYFVKKAEKVKDDSDDKIAAMGSQIEKIVARGNVVIVRGENTSNSDEAVYTASDNKIKLSGKPKLVIYSSKDMGSAFAQ